MVKFRDEEELSRLTRHAQSGGERALTTALYLMALQRLAAVPFRCVDEINQGMDPINERKMFQLLVKVTTETDNAQYFLLSPKLLMSLEYNPRVAVHTVMNGRHVADHRRWDVGKFIENAQYYET
ncbi:Structural maintenance of chromosomes protein 5 [Eumeta japonica]|uniref:Structural maintenance of chromosomes protein 5 n=1 Tax=Eumeta variegata TaxID=151549 RepID=A0A4C1ZWL8_EUMVA|nr:Structural maintenance of chromosomes protein 5 [Eumeta japonica]